MHIAHAAYIPVLTLTLLTAPALTTATTLVDQPSFTNELSTASFFRIGQSFAISAATLDKITVPLSNINVGMPIFDNDSFMTLRLYEGTGFGGQQLATSTVDVASILGGSLATKALVDFSVGGVNLDTGSYTFELIGTSGRYGISLSLGNNPYADGSAQYSTFLPMFPSANTSDLAFSVHGIAPIPEPTQAALLLLGLAGIAVHARRKTSAA